MSHPVGQLQFKKTEISRSGKEVEQLGSANAAHGL